MKGIYSVLVFLLSFSPAFAAISAPTNLSIHGATDTSVQLDWDDVDGAIGYYLYYGTKTASGGVYETEGIDLIEESEFSLKNLKASTRYYIAVSAIDAVGTESKYSQEIDYATLKQGQTDASKVFRIIDASVQDATTLELLFSTDLPSSLVGGDFMIQEDSSGQEVVVEVSDIDPTNSKNLIVVLGESLKTQTKYKVTILDMKDAQGQNIESGIDAFLHFTTPLSFQKPEEIVPETLPEGDLNAAPEEKLWEETPMTPQTLLGNNAGTTISGVSVWSSLQATAQENQKLPQTGPEHWFLLFVAMFLSAGIYFYAHKKETL